MSLPDPFIVAIVGAESTGKTFLAETLATRLLQDTGLRCTWVPEHLRDWCNQHGRTPRKDEQLAIAQTQQRHIDQAALDHDVVICDTTPLSTAAYSRLLFGDDSLLTAAATWQRRCALTLLMALDLPWVADGLQRDGPQVQVPVDNILRQVLLSNRLPWALVSGHGASREEQALNAVAPLLRRRTMPGDGIFTRLTGRQEESSRWYWRCDTCDLPDCEHMALRVRRGEKPSA